MPALTGVSTSLAKIEINDPNKVTVAAIIKMTMATNERIPGGKSTTFSPALILSVSDFRLSSVIAFINKHQTLQ